MILNDKLTNEDRLEDQIENGIKLGRPNENNPKLEGAKMYFYIFFLINKISSITDVISHMHGP